MHQTVAQVGIHMAAAVVGGVSPLAFRIYKCMSRFAHHLWLSPSHTLLALQVLDFEAYANYARDDLAQRCQHAPPPMFIGGHSLGGLIAALTCLRDQQRWAGLLVLSAALDVEWTLSLRYVEA